MAAIANCWDPILNFQLWRFSLKTLRHDWATSLSQSWNFSSDVFHLRRYSNWLVDIFNSMVRPRFTNPHQVQYLGSPYPFPKKERKTGRMEEKGRERRRERRMEGGGRGRERWMEWGREGKTDGREKGRKGRNGKISLCPPRNDLIINTVSQTRNLPLPNSYELCYQNLQPSQSASTLSYH